MDGADEQEELRRALAGHERALDRLVTSLTPVIQARVARCLLRWRAGSAGGRNVRQEVEDLSQEIFVLLFDDGGKVLRSWQPERGLPLARFVDLVTERRVVSILRSGRRNPWRDDPTLPEELDREAPEQGPEALTASREEWRLLVRRLAEELSPLGRHLFDLLFVRELPLVDVVAQTGMSPDAVYAWRSRLRRLVRRLLAAESENAADRRSSSAGVGA